MGCCNVVGCGCGGCDHTEPQVVVLRCQHCPTQIEMYGEGPYEAYHRHGTDLVWMVAVEDA